MTDADTTPNPRSRVRVLVSEPVPQELDEGAGESTPVGDDPARLKHSEWCRCIRCLYARPPG